MRKFLKKVLTVLLLNTLIITNVFPAYANESNTKKEENIKFEYPITPLTEEWSELNHGERVLASQIPSHVLEALDTESLLDAVLAYPCFIDMIFYDTYQQGFETVYEHFNGLQELFSREDASEVILNKYNNANICTLMNIQNTNERFELSLNTVYLEMMLAQPDIYTQMNNQNIELLNELAEENYKLRLDNSEQIISPSFSAYYQSLAEQQGVQMIDSAATVTTPNGSTVPVIIRTGTDTAYNIRAAIKSSIEKNYPGAVVVGDATIKYNCHAYAWAMQPYVWMNDPSQYWLDGSYNVQSVDSPGMIGQKAYYGGVGKEHSGIVVSLSGNHIRSKWGEQSLVEHSISNCPYFFIPLSVNFYGR